MPHPDDLPDPASLRVDEVTVAWELVEHLTPRQRSVIVLRYAHDLSLREIARRKGINEATVRDAIARGLARLRRLAGPP